MTEEQHFKYVKLSSFLNTYNDIKKLISNDGEINLRFQADSTISIDMTYILREKFAKIVDESIAEIEEDMKKI